MSSPAIKPQHGASYLLRWKLCPGSRRMEKDLPDQDSEMSRQGRLLHLHDAEPTLDRSPLSMHQRDLLDKSARLTADVLAAACEHFGISKDETAERGTEREMWLHRGIKAVLPGHSDEDFYFADRKVLIVIDKKFGFKTVTHAEANLQLRAYACMSAEQRDCSGGMVVALTQPRLPMEERLTMAVYLEEDIQKGREEIFAILDATEDPEAPLEAGEEQCRYCKAKMLCPAYIEVFHALAEVQPMDLSTVTADQLSRVLMAITFAAHIKDDARNEARRRIAEGQLPGWKLGKESTVREITDVREAVGLVNTVLDQEDILACITLPIGAVEERIRAVTGCTAKAAKERVNQLLAPVLDFSTRKARISQITK